jgi:hypothetical protein
MNVISCWGLMVARFLSAFRLKKNKKKKNSFRMVGGYPPNPQ